MIRWVSCWVVTISWVSGLAVDYLMGRRVIHKVNRWVGVLVTGSLSVFVGGSVCVVFGMT